MTDNIMHKNCTSVLVMSIFGNTILFKSTVTKFDEKAFAVLQLPVMYNIADD